MSRKMIAVLAPATAALALSAAALGAQPKKGGLYTATIEGNTQTLVSWIKLQVRPDGKSARVIWSCNGAPPPTTLTFKLNADGTFKGVSNPSGHLLIWYIQSRFVSPTEARVYLSLNLACAGKGVHTVLKLKQ